MSNTVDRAIEQSQFESSGRAKAMEILRKLALFLVLLVLMAFFATQNENFLTLRNAMTVLRSVSITGVIALGMTLVIISGEIDLSVGSMVALSGVFTAWLFLRLAGAFGPGAEVISVIIAIAASLLVGTLVGVFTASLRNYLRIPSFITTLGLLTALSGAAYLISDGFPIIGFPQWYNYIGAGWLFAGRFEGFPGIPFQVIILFVVFLFLFVLLQFTGMGRSIYAVGANEESARLSGVNVRFVRCVAFGATGFLAALSGIMVSSQIMSGTPAVGAGGEMNAISAVIIGGASLSGGVGKITGTLIGILFLGVVQNGMTMMGMNTHWQAVVRGALVIGAVLFNMMVQKRA